MTRTKLKKSDKKKLVCRFYGVPKDMRPYLRQKLKAHDSKIFSEPITVDILDPATEALGVFIESAVTKEIIEALPQLQFIATLSTGYDHISLAPAKKRHIPVCNVPTYGENTVAEHAFALMLGLTRKLFASVKRVKEGVYDYEGLRGMDIRGKTVGVVGTGHIGSHFVRMLYGFGVTILAYDPFPNEALVKETGCRYVPLITLLKESDIVSLHVPLTSETHHLINKKNIGLMKKGSLLINTARGALVDPESLVMALESHQLGGAGLDVLENEELVKHPAKFLYQEGKDALPAIRTSVMNSILINHPNVIVTPHNAFNSTEALRRIIDVTVENIEAFAVGKVQNDVTTSRQR